MGVSKVSLRILLEMEIRSRDINNLSLRFTLRHMIPDTWNSVTLLLLCNACMDFLKEIFGKKQTNKPSSWCQMQHVSDNVKLSGIFKK